MTGLKDKTKKPEYLPSFSGNKVFVFETFSSFRTYCFISLFSMSNLHLFCFHYSYLRFIQWYFNFCTISNLQKIQACMWKT